MVDEFILFDDMQYTRRDWRNRNLIKTKDGLKWLTIPVEVKGKYYQKIKDTKVSSISWGEDHWKTIRHNYSAASHFREFRDIFEPLYCECQEEFLSRINYRFLKAICGILNINTKISWAMDYPLLEGKTERLIGLCKSAGAAHYLSGPAAKDYIDEKLFKKEGISLSYMDYSGYPPYSQLYGEFAHNVSIMDLLFNEGQQAKKYMKSF